MIAVGMAGSLMTGCGDVAGSLGGPERAAPQMNVYRLKPGDKLKIAVFNEPDLTGEFQVSDSGKIAFPLTGEIEAGGLSVDDFRAGLVGRLREGFVRNPRVTIDFVNYRPINVIGEVRNAGQYAYRPGLTVQDAIAMAGGYTYRANTRTFYLRRSDQSSETTLRTDAAGLTVLPGDNIRVPERYF
jgi:polysaccharide export outer membrane protein